MPMKRTVHWRSERHYSCRANAASPPSLVSEIESKILPRGRNLLCVTPRTQFVHCSPLLALAPAVSWPWVLAWGSLEPPRRDGENAQKTGKNGEKMGEIRPKECEPRELTKDQLAQARHTRSLTVSGSGWWHVERREVCGPTRFAGHSASHAARPKRAGQADGARGQTGFATG